MSSVGRAVLGLLLLVSGAGLEAQENAGPAKFIGHLEPLGGLVEGGPHGRAIFELNPSGDELAFKLIAVKVDNLTTASLHRGKDSETGPRLAMLYAGPPRRGRSNGELVASSLKAADLQGPLAGRPLAELVAAIRSGNTYVLIRSRDKSEGALRGRLQIEEADGARPPRPRW